MLKISLVTFYEVKEFILSIKNALETLLYEVNHYPLFQYAYDSNDKVENVALHMAKSLQRLNPDIVFWIFSDVDLDVFKLVRSSLNPKTKFVLYAPDAIIVNDVFLARLNYFNYIILHDSNIVDELVRFSHFDIDHIFYFPRCYDDTIYNAEVIADTKYESDLVYVNHVADENSIYAIRQIAAQAKTAGIKFSVYGSLLYGEAVTENYRGNFSYLEEPIIYKSSKMVIVDNPVNLNKVLVIQCRYVGLSSKMETYQRKYIGDYRSVDNERLLYLWKNSLLVSEEQLDKILSSTYKMMVLKLHTKICKDLFDPQYYLDKYLSTKGIIDVKNATALWQYFLNNDLSIGIIPFEFSVPEIFDHKAYRESVKDCRDISSWSNERLYWHWKTYSNSATFSKLQRSITLDLDTNQCPNVTTRGLSQLYLIFSQIYNKYGDTADNLMTLVEVIQQNPTIDLTRCLELYQSWRQQLEELTYAKNSRT